MVDRIIKFLGGFTNSEFRMCELERDSYKTSSDSLKGQLIQAEKYFDFMHQEGKAFKDLFMAQMGLGAMNPPSMDDMEKMKPLRTQAPSARQIMREMEEDDRQRAKSMRDTGDPKVA